MTEIITTTTDSVRGHYLAMGLTDRIRSALATLAPGDQTLTVTQLAPLDQFHIRGILATRELASAAGLDSSSRVLDLGSGIGGPARFLAATFGCTVTGVDLSPGFVDAATYLTMRCGLADRVTFQEADAQHLPFEPGAFDAVFLQHVAMNIQDRAALYAGVHRILTPGGRFATYDVVLRDGAVVYPVPWARDASTSFLLTEADTRTALEYGGFQPVLWRDDSDTAADWFRETMAGPPPARTEPALSLGLVLGPDFQVATTNLARNIRERRLGVLSAVLTRGA